MPAWLGLGLELGLGLGLGLGLESTATTATSTASRASPVSRSAGCVAIASRSTLASPKAASTVSTVPTASTVPTVSASTASASTSASLTRTRAPGISGHALQPSGGAASLGSGATHAVTEFTGGKPSGMGAFEARMTDGLVVEGRSRFPGAIGTAGGGSATASAASSKSMRSFVASAARTASSDWRCSRTCCIVRIRHDVWLRVTRKACSVCKC